MRRMILVLCLPGASRLWGAIEIDVAVSTDKSSPSPNFTSPSFSTTSPNELLLAVVCADAMSASVTVASVSGANLTWVGLEHKCANGRRIGGPLHGYPFKLTLGKRPC
jgi:hypothetical protein